MAHDSRSTAWVGFDGRNRQEIKHGERYTLVSLCCSLLRCHVSCVSFILALLPCLMFVLHTGSVHASCASFILALLPCLMCVLHTGSVTCMMVSSTVSWLLPVPGPYPPSTTRAMSQTGLIASQNASIGMPGNHKNQIRYSGL